ncbi:MAG: methyltransferase domain-containing protein [Burkholderiaceae bacterium]
MGCRIISLPHWLQTPAGQLALNWERTRVDQTVANRFGFHALQLGMPELDALRMNRMPHRWLALEQPYGQVSGANAASLPTPSTVADNTVIAAGAASSGPSPALRRLALVTDFCALPFPANSLDLIVLPHALESSGDPHALLREVGRVLVPEGRVVICGLNPASLWALRERRGRLYRQLGLNSPSYLPQDGQPIGFWRLRDWLRLLSFEVESSSFGCWQPAMRSERWLKSFEWIDRSGKRWWPIFGALYFVVATKRVRGMRLTSIVRRRKAKSAAGAPVSVANRRRPKSARETAAVEVERS